MAVLIIGLSLAFALCGRAAALAQDGAQLGRLGIVAKLGRSREADDRQLSLMRQLGVSVVIWTPGEWANNEKTPGEYSLAPEVEYVISRIAAAHMQMVVVLFRKNTLYPNPLDPDAFGRYCSWLVTALRGEPVAAYQIWNEPSNFDVREEYGGSWNGRDDALWVAKFSDLMHIAARSILEADAHATVIASFEGPPLIYAMQGHAPDFDNIEGISIHPYPGRYPAEQVPWGGTRIAMRDGVSVADADGSLISTLRIQTADDPAKYLGHPLQAWVTEYGFPTCDPGSIQNNFACVDGMEQAAYHARGMLVGFAHGVKVWAPYELADEGGNWSDAEQNFGLTRSAAGGYAPKASFFTIQRIARVLGMHWRYLDPSPATLELCGSEGKCKPTAVSTEASAVSGPQMLWFKEDRGYAGFVWNAGEFRSGSTPAHIEWRGPVRSGLHIQVTELSSGKATPWQGDFKDTLPLQVSLPLQSQPVMVEIRE
jgi:hypothetical protein